MKLIKLCIFIFFIKILNVSLGTIRTIISVKGKNIIASIIGFIEVLIWFLIVKEALNSNEKSILIAISYSLGSAIGTYIGGILSNKFIKTNLNIQIITSKENLLKILKQNNFGTTLLNENKNNKKYLLFTEIKSNRFNELKNLINKIDSKAFIIVNETKYVINGYF